MNIVYRAGCLGRVPARPIVLGGPKMSPPVQIFRAIYFINSTGFTNKLLYLHEVSSTALHLW